MTAAPYSPLSNTTADAAMWPTQRPGRPTTLELSQPIHLQISRPTNLQISLHTVEHQDLCRLVDKYLPSTSAIPTLVLSAQSHSKSPVFSI
jgi:hypothetical protein